MRSTPGVRSDLFHRKLGKTLLTDFFGGVSQAEVVAEEAIESHTMSTPTGKVSHLDAGEKKLEAAKPFAIKIDTLKELSSMSDSIPSASIRAWAGASLLGLLVAWIAISEGRAS